MRQVQVHTTADRAGTVLRLAREHGARAPVALPTTADGALAVVDLPNDQVGSFVDAVHAEVHDAHVVLLPVGTLPLETPLERVSAKVADVSRLSTIELVLGSLQSVGSLRGLVLFSIFAGVIGAYGLIFDAAYLLVGAMLINPMGAPALVSVVAMAVGSPRMFGRGAARFLLSLLLQSTAAMAVGFGYRLDVSTAMIEQVTSLSLFVTLVALAAGAAGAQTLVKSDRDSLVSGTAAGFMVAAALAPPSAVLGLAVPLGRWDHAELMAFLLVLQFAAIGVGGFASLWLFGVRPSEATAGRGRPRWRNLLVAGVLLSVALLVGWQVHQGTRYTKADRSRRALEVTRAAVSEVPHAALVDSSARFVGSDVGPHRGEALLVEVTVERTASDLPESALSSDIREAVSERIRDRMPNVTPFVDVTVLPGPSSPTSTDRPPSASRRATGTRARTSRRGRRSEEGRAGDLDRRRRPGATRRALRPDPDLRERDPPTAT